MLEPEQRGTERRRRRRRKPAAGASRSASE